MIFAEGIATGYATFKAEPPMWERFDSGKVAHSRFVAVEANGEILGWVAASAVSLRDLYSGVVGHSVYVAIACEFRWSSLCEHRGKPAIRCHAGRSARACPGRVPRPFSGGQISCMRRRQPLVAVHQYRND